MDKSERQSNKHNVDITKVTLNVTYLSLLLGIGAPAALLLAGYVMDAPDRHRFQDPAHEELFFWLLIGLSVAESLAAIMLKKRLFARPMILSETSFAQDFAAGMRTNSLTIFVVVDAIAVYGLSFFLLGGNLDGLALFCIFSVVAFQLVRPRAGFVEQILERQERLVAEGKLATRRER
ncbi:MAG: hypothetical protein ACE5GA_11830 [Candidatus Zixiibacteriota bacterium]